MHKATATVYDFEARQINGQEIALSAFKGKVMLIVNTASQCGFTPQFGGLEELHKAYGGKGLVVLGFPCNQFGAQDPGQDSEIATFCQVNYGVSFPLMSKVDVNGPAAHPLYQWLSAQLKPTLVRPAAMPSKNSCGYATKPRQALNCTVKSPATISRYISAVAHKGCRPWPCRWRNGHQETPQTKAFNTSAPAASVAVRPGLTGAISASCRCGRY